jgi:hypothetical protein
MSVATSTVSLIKGPRETRKFPRLTIPMSVRVNDIIYAVFNWSTDGIGVTNFSSEILSGQVINIGLLLDTGDATIRIDLIAKVIWTNPATKQCGMQFVNPELKKVTLMNEVIGLNLTKYSKKSANQTFGIEGNDKELAEFSSGRERVKRIIGLCLFAAVGVSSVLFLGKLLYDRMFLFEAASASVFSETTSLMAPGEGIVKNIVAAGTVKDGQVLAKIELTTGGIAEVLSSCACETISILKKNGSFVRAGEPVINLVKADAKPVVSVRIAFHDLERVVKGASLSLLYLDGTAVNGATIKELPKIVDDRSSLITLYVDAGRELTPSQVGQPVYAVINTAPW